MRGVYRDMRFIERLFSRTRDRDGQYRSLAQPAEPAAESASPIPRPAGIDEAIATKLLEGWLANRRQTQVPHTLNMAALEPAQARMIAEVMAAAANADGRLERSERRQVDHALTLGGAGTGERAAFQAAVATPPDLNDLLQRVAEAGLGAHAYAGALLAINRASRVNQLFLRYLAARLALPQDVAASLRRRYRA